MGHLQAVYRPPQLREGAVTVGTPYLSHHQQIGIGIFHHMYDVPKSSGAGFLRCLTTLHHTIAQPTIPEATIAPSHHLRQ